MRKNVLTKALALALCAFTVAPMFACGGGGNKGVGGEKVDETKTQLSVFHYFAGFGDAWLVELMDDFEELVKDVEFEPGKKGVQVQHRGDMHDFSAAELKTSQYDVFFLESPKDFINIIADNAVEPLDSIMEVPNPDDNNQSIASKMTQQQKDFYYYNGHYYGIPHYVGHYGLIYNRELFDSKGFYIAETPDEESGDILISETRPEKHAGPDGIKGNEDDGLPRTYDEFFALCEEMNARGVDPVCFPGAYAQQHLISLLDNLVATYEGAEQMNLNYTFSGTAKDLVVFNANGAVKFNADGTPATEEVEINSENAYLLSRQAGRYYAFDFMQRLLSNKDYYNNEDGENGSISHTINQQNFIENESLGKKSSAMLVDGTWWQSEADDVFSYMAENDSKYAKENRKFGWMPLPQPTEAEAAKIASGEKKSVYMDYLNAVACIKSGLSDGTKAAALAFLKYAYTDKALAKFTYTTGTTVGVEYLDAVDRSKLNYYETSLINYIEKSEKVYQVSGNKSYSSKRSALMPKDIYGSFVDDKNYNSFVTAIWDDRTLTTEEYFYGHQAFYKGIAW